LPLFNERLAVDDLEDAFYGHDDRDAVVSGSQQLANPDESLELVEEPV